MRHFVKRRTKTVKAVDEINFEIEEGEIVGFIGPNGAGKTTTLKMLCGLIHPSKGTVTVSGHIPRFRKSKFLKDITLVMGQKQQLIWDLPPMDSLKVNAAIYGLNKRDASKRIDELASMLEIDEELTKPVRKLSLGQRMKAELLAALLHRPSVLFLDEPTLGLDVNAQVKVREFLKSYNSEYGATILLTSHYMGDITSLCKRVILIFEGRLIYDGLLKDLTNNLSPYRSVRIEFYEPKPKYYFEKFGKVESYGGQIVTILIDRERLTESISSILSNFSIKDLEITDPPIEKLMGNLFMGKQS